MLALLHGSAVNCARPEQGVNDIIKRQVRTRPATSEAPVQNNGIEQLYRVTLEAHSWPGYVLARGKIATCWPQILSLKGVYHL